MYTSGPFSICEGDSGLLHTSFLYPNLQWLRNDTAIAGANNDSYYAKSAGVYTVISSIDNCPSLPSPSLVVTTRSTPAKPTISIQDSYLVSSERYYNHWYYNNSNYLTDTLQTFRIQGTGKYYVEIRYSNGCKSRSDTLNYTGASPLSVSSPQLTEVKNSRQEKSIVLFPNPATTVLKINAAGFEGSVILTVYDALGRQKITQRVTNTGIMQLDIQQLPDATYLLELKSSKGSVKKWFTKIN